MKGYNDCNSDPGDGCETLTTQSCKVGEMCLRSGQTVCWPTVAFAKSFGTDTIDPPPELALDANGNIYLAGQFPRGFSQNLNFGTGDLTGTVGQYSMFIASLNAAGIARWVLSVVPSAIDAGVGGVGATAIAVSGDHTYVGGHIGASADFSGTGIRLTPSKGPLFLASYRAGDGTYEWAVQLDGKTLDTMVLDAAGNVYVVGSFQGSVDFGDGKIIGDPDGDAGTTTPGFVASYASDHHCRWAWAFAGCSVRVAVDNQSNAYLAGSFTRGASVAGQVLQPSGGVGMFLAKLSADSGTITRLRTFEGDVAITVGAVAADAYGDVYVTGSIPGTADWRTGAAGQPEHAFQQRIRLGVLGQLCRWRNLSFCRCV